MDDCEELLAQVKREEGATESVNDAFQGLLARMLRDVPSMKLVLTSRVKPAWSDGEGRTWLGMGAVGGASRR